MEPTQYPAMIIKIYVLEDQVVSY